MEADEMKTWDFEKREWVPVKWSEPDALGYRWAAITPPDISMNLLLDGVVIGSIG